MGYSTTLGNWQMLLEAIRNERLILPGLRMAELGNQYIWPDVFRTPKRLVAKQVFEAFGVEHVSIDINGLDGALPLDLCKPLPDDLSTFDLVTNCGTAEHVANQYECWLNINRLCRVGGIMLHQGPEVGSWKEHGAVIWYTVGQFEAIATSCGYDVLRLSRFERSEAGRPYNSVQAVFRKTSARFPQCNVFGGIMK